MPTIVAIVLDLLAVFVFAAIGRSSHSEALDLAGVTHTALPFVLAALMGWVFVLIRRLLASVWVHGAVVWGFTVAVGMLARFLLGEGVQPAFVAVAAIALAALFFGWRAVAHLVLRGTASPR